jgi:signal-induced proliferation-associated 1 like protein 3
MLPLPEVPLEPEAPLPLPPDEEPLPMLPLLELPLEPELSWLLCFFECFFLVDLWVVDEGVDEVPVLWSCALVPVLAPVPPVEELLLVCA